MKIIIHCTNDMKHILMRACLENVNYLMIAVYAYYDACYYDVCNCRKGKLRIKG